jgi:hypothetical protein
MTAPTPETLARDITDGINRLLQQSDEFRSIDSPQVLALLEQIEKFSDIDPAEALVRRAAISAICGRAEDLPSLYARALDLSAGGDVRHEFWVNFCNVADYRRAAEVGAWLLDPKNGFFPSVWKQALALGQIRLVASHLMKAQNMFRTKLADEDFSVLGQATKAMQSHALTDQAVIDVLDIAGQIQRAHGIMYSGIGPSLNVMAPPDEPAYLSVHIPVDVQTTKVHQMNRDLGRAIVERLPARKFPEGLVVSFRQAVKQEPFRSAA